MEAHGKFMNGLTNNFFSAEQISLNVWYQCHSLAIENVQNNGLSKLSNKFSFYLICQFSRIEYKTRQKTAHEITWKKITQVIVIKRMII